MQALKETLELLGMADESKHPASWGPRIEDRGAQITFSALGQQAPLEAKEMQQKLHEADRDRLRIELTKRLPDFSVSEGGLTTVQVNPKGVDKAYGIRQLIALTGVSVSEMLYVGDALEEGGNDSVVIATDVHTQKVFGPEETAALIKSILHDYRPAPSV
jgi:hydroxymethylpyrimidine pyrophosphatase-like HAD family hydrolase